MLEIPESTVISCQLKAELVGKTITKVIAGKTPHGFAFFSGDPKDYSQMLTGLKIDDVYSLAGLVEISAENMRILFGDGTNIRYTTKIPEKHQLHIEFDDGNSIVCTIQMYGGIWAFEKGENQNPYYLVTKEKPSVFTQEFSIQHFKNLIAEGEKSLSLKGLLATKQRLPGLGNGCLQDILFNAGMHPKKKVNTLTDAQTEILYNSTISTLKEMTAQGGRDTEKNIYGKQGGYSTILSAKTHSNPCPKCNGGIVKQAYMGGNVYFCPACQSM